MAGALPAYLDPTMNRNRAVRPAAGKVTIPPSRSCTASLSMARNGSKLPSPKASTRPLHLAARSRTLCHLMRPGYGGRIARLWPVPSCASPKEVRRQASHRPSRRGPLCDTPAPHQGHQGTRREARDTPYGPDSEHAVEYSAAPAPVVLLLLHDFPDPGKSHRYGGSSPPRTR